MKKPVPPSLIILGIFIMMLLTATIGVFIVIPLYMRLILVAGGYPVP